MIAGLAEAMAADLRRRGIDAAEVIDFDEEVEYGGYCSTCAYEYAVLDITYKTSEGAVEKYRIGESFAEYIKYMTK